MNNRIFITNNNQTTLTEKNPLMSLHIMALHIIGAFHKIYPQKSHFTYFSSQKQANLLVPKFVCHCVCNRKTSIFVDVAASVFGTHSIHLCQAKGATWLVHTKAKIQPEMVRCVVKLYYKLER